MTNSQDWLNTSLKVLLGSVSTLAIISTAHAQEAPVGETADVASPDESGYEDEVQISTLQKPVDHLLHRPNSCICCETAFRA